MIVHNFMNFGSVAVTTTDIQEYITKGMTATQGGNFTISIPRKMHRATTQRIATKVLLSGDMMKNELHE